MVTTSKKAFQGSLNSVAYLLDIGSASDSYENRIEERNEKLPKSLLENPDHIIRLSDQVRMEKRICGLWRKCSRTSTLTIMSPTGIRMESL